MKGMSYCWHWEERDSQALPLVALLDGGWQRVSPLHPEDCGSPCPGARPAWHDVKQGWAVEGHQSEEVQRWINAEGYQSSNPALCSLGCVVRTVLAEFVIYNCGGAFVSGCLKHDFLMFLGCFHSSVQWWVPLPQRALNLSWNLWQSSCASSLSYCSHLASALNANWELFSFLVTVGLLPVYTKCKSSHEKILSVSSVYTFHVWQALFLVTTEFLPCTVLFVPLEHWTFSSRALSLTWHSTLVLYCSVHWRQLHGSSKFTGMQIYYLLFSNSVGHMFILYAWVLFWNNTVYTIDRFKVD